MALKPHQFVPVLYDLAMLMAGETRPYELANTMLQRLMLHTGYSAGLLLLDPVPEADGETISTLIYTAVGGPALRVLEGETKDWPSAMLEADEVVCFQEGPLPSGIALSYSLSFVLPGLGYILLLCAKLHQGGGEQKILLAPVLSRFASSLRHLRESEAISRNLVQSESRIRGILESTPDWIWETSVQGVITFSNRRVLDILGYSADDVLGRELFDLMSSQEAGRGESISRDMLAGHAEFHDVENICIHKDGRQVILESRGVPIFDGQGNISGYRGLTRDITERKRIEKVLISARDQARASDHAKSQFLSSMSHEFRTPLNAILGYAQLMEMQEDLPEDLKTGANEILMAGKTLLELINNVLELSRIKSGKPDLVIEAIPVGPLIQKCAGQFAEVAARKREPINCVGNCQDCFVLADRTSLMLVLNQLVSNAIKFNHEGRQVTIGCRAVSAASVRISVQDHGIGIPPQVRESLFVPFSRLNMGEGENRGAGVGLTIAKQLVTAMSGEIGVDSLSGEGSTFWIELPAAESEAVIKDTRPYEQGAERKQPPDQVRILVAEDYPANQNVLKIQLEHLGCRVDMASNGEEALVLWQAHHYDLVLTDLNMPVKDGMALARDIRQLEAHIGRYTPILSISASDYPEVIDACDQAGIDGCLMKPITLEALQKAIQQWVKEKSQLVVDTVGHPSSSRQAYPVNFSESGQILGGLGEHASKLRATFIESARQGLSRVTAENDIFLAIEEMHKLKSAAVAVGAAAFAKMADALERELRAGSRPDLLSSIERLEQELVRASRSFDSLEQSNGLAADGVPGHGVFRGAMILEHEPAILQQLAAILSSLDIGGVAAVDNVGDMIRFLMAGTSEPDLLLCDLNPPEMDGVELIRQLGQTGFSGDLILIGGGDGDFLTLARKLADHQGLRVLGELRKPITSKQLERLIQQKRKSSPSRPSGGDVKKISLDDLIGGMERDEFTIWLQPTVNVGQLMPTGVEALARWHHPSLGMIPPGIFIEIAEQGGLIREFSQILVSKALMEGAKLHAAGFALDISINLSGLWLDDQMLPNFVLATTHAAQLRPSDVILEVTEAGVMKDLTKALDVLSRLQLKGFRLSIDDFGIGYSSVEQLDRIPFTEMKIDRNFVNRATHESAAYDILKSSMDMAGAMMLSTVAEGVETEEELQMVRKLGCDRVQGFYVASPMPLDDLVAWLKTREKVA